VACTQVNASLLIQHLLAAWVLVLVLYHLSKSPNSEFQIFMYASQVGFLFLFSSSFSISFSVFLACILTIFFSVAFFSPL
jgi:hypothetical protein